MMFEGIEYETQTRVSPCYAILMDRFISSGTRAMDDGLYAAKMMTAELRCVTRQACHRCCWCWLMRLRAEFDVYAIVERVLPGEGVPGLNRPIGR